MISFMPRSLLDFPKRGLGMTLHDDVIFISSFRNRDDVITCSCYSSLFTTPTCFISVLATLMFIPRCTLAPMTWPECYRTTWTPTYMSTLQPTLLQVRYHIAGNFRKRKLSRIGEKYNLCGESFVNCSLCCAKGCHTPKFHRENFRKTTKFANVFSLKCFPLYSTIFVPRLFFFKFLSVCHSAWCVLVTLQQHTCTHCTSTVYILVPQETFVCWVLWNGSGTILESTSPFPAPKILEQNQ